jgi:hypothetical protein
MINEGGVRVGSPLERVPFGACRRDYLGGDPWADKERCEGCDKCVPHTCRVDEYTV